MKNTHVQIAWRISLSYALLVSCWIFIADYVLGTIVPATQPAVWLATYPKVIFVVLTTLLLYRLVLREVRLRPVELLVSQTAPPPDAMLATTRANPPPTTDLYQRLADSDRLQQLTTALLQQKTLDDLLPLVCTEAQQLTNAGGARLLLQENEAWFRVFHQTGNVMPNLERFPIGNAQAEVALLAKTVVITNDPTHFPLFFQLYPDLKSLAAIPLLLKDELIGTLQIVNKPGGFTEADAHLLRLFAEQAAIAITNAQLHEQAKQQAVAKERQRLARELHDSVTQVLYSVILYADATRLALATDKKSEATANLHELRTLTRQAMADLRLLLFRLHPPELEEEGLVAALQARLEAIEARAGLRIDLRVEGKNSLPIAIEDVLYKVAQEALNNVVKHAKAEQVTVHLHFTEQQCRLTIQDDGVGFDLAATQGGGGMGLRSIAERIEQVGGHLQLESMPTQGTKLQIVVQTHLVTPPPLAADQLRPAAFTPQAFASRRSGTAG